jgi:hypothetical protein
VLHHACIAVHSDQILEQPSEPQTDCAGTTTHFQQPTASSDGRLEQRLQRPLVAKPPALIVLSRVGIPLGGHVPHSPAGAPSVQTSCVGAPTGGGKTALLMLPWMVERALNERTPFPV